MTIASGVSLAINWVVAAIAEPGYHRNGSSRIEAAMLVTSSLSAKIWRQSQAAITTVFRKSAGAADAKHHVPEARLVADQIDESLRSSLTEAGKASCRCRHT